MDAVGGGLVCIVTLGLVAFPLRQATLVLLHTAPKQLLTEVTKTLREVSGNVYEDRSPPFSSHISVGISLASEVRKQSGTLLSIGERTGKLC